MTSNAARRPAVIFTAVAIAASCAAPASAQVGDISGVNYPGWIPSDGVVPNINIIPLFIGTPEGWRYDFGVGNAPSALQEILTFDLRFRLPSSAVPSISSPVGWWHGFYSDVAAVPGVTFHARQAGTANPPPPSPDQIPAGGSLSGFLIESPYPPGYARAYVQGYAGFPRAANLGDEDYTVPHDTTNAQRRWTLGPTRYTEVVTGGNRRPATDGFLGFMNLSEKSSILTDPAPIALKFSLNGETVFTETLEVKLNGTDVTDAFHPGPGDGADLVGVFAIGSSPLQEGKNVLLTSVDGIVPSNGNTGKDADRIVFMVDPSLAESGTAGSTNALENLPFPEPGLERGKLLLGKDHVQHRIGVVGSCAQHNIRNDCIGQP